MHPSQAAQLHLFHWFRCTPKHLATFSRSAVIHWGKKTRSKPHLIYELRNYTLIIESWSNGIKIVNAIELWRQRSQKLFNRFVAPAIFRIEWWAAHRIIDIDQQCKTIHTKILSENVEQKKHRVPFQMHMIMSFVVVANNQQKTLTTWMIIFAASLLNRRPKQSQ